MKRDLSAKKVSKIINKVLSEDASEIPVNTLLKNKCMQSGLLLPTSTTISIPGYDCITSSDSFGVRSDNSSVFLSDLNNYSSKILGVRFTPKGANAYIANFNNLLFRVLFIPASGNGKNGTRIEVFSPVSNNDSNINNTVKKIHDFIFGIRNNV